MKIAKLITLKNLGLLLAVKKTASKAEQGADLVAVTKEITSKYLFWLRIKFSIPLFLVGCVLYFFNPIVGCACIAFAVLLVLNFDVFLQFVFFTFFTTAFFLFFGKLTIAVLVTLPIWVLYNVYLFLRQPIQQVEADQQTETETRDDHPIPPSV